MIVAFSISPSGGDETGGVSEAVAEAVRVVRESGLPNETNAMFTNIEGEWDEVMAVVKQAVDVVAARLPAGRPGAQGRHPSRVRRPAHRQGRARRGAPAWELSRSVRPAGPGDAVHRVVREAFLERGGEGERALGRDRAVRVRPRAPARAWVAWLDAQPPRATCGC